MRLRISTRTIVAAALGAALAACSAKAPSPAPPAAEPAKPITLEGARTPEAGPPAQSEPAPAGAGTTLN